MKRIRNLFIVTMMFLFCFNMKSFAEPATWVQNKELPALENGVTNWSYIDTNRMYVKSSWKEINSKWYYFNENGFMLASTNTPDGYIVDKNGEWKNQPGYYTNNKSGSWNVSGEVLDDVMDKGNGLIAVFENRASYNQGDITLNKNNNEYTVDIGVRLTTPKNQNALKQMLRLIGENSGELYNALYNSFEGDSNINYNDYVQVGSYQIKAVNNGNSVTYLIK